MNVLDPVVICPYDRNHKIARSRIHKHLVKCEKNFPKEYKSICPFNATHRYFKDELADHVLKCSDRHAMAALPDTISEQSSEKAEAEVLSDDDIWDPNENNVVDIGLLDEIEDRVPKWVEKTQLEQERYLDTNFAAAEMDMGDSFYMPGVGRGKRIVHEETELKPAKLIGLGRAKLIEKFKLS